MWEIRRGAISMERLDGETIVINFDTGAYFSFRGASADVLWLIDHRVPQDSWVTLLEQSFQDVEIDADVVAQISSFITELTAAGVIIEVDGNEGPVVALPDDYTRVEWTPPQVQAQDDLADLLLIDPIHDTSEDGWPQTRSQ